MPAEHLRAVPPPPDEPRMPAHDMGAEGAVISALLVSPTAAARVVQMLRPDDFYAESHRRIVEAVFALFNVGRPTDLVTVATWLRDHGRLEQVGGSTYMTEVLSAAPAVGHVEAYAETVVRKSRVRRMQAACARLVAESYAPLGDEDDWLDRAEAAVHAVGAARSKGIESRSMREVAEAVYDSWVEAEKNPTLAAMSGGIPTGLTAIDVATGGYHRGEVWVIGASPGLGKTSFAIQSGAEVALRNYGVLVFSLEMPDEQLASRRLCAAAEVSVGKARNRLFDSSDWPRLLRAVEDQAALDHMHIVDDPHCGLREMRSLSISKSAEMTRAGRRLGLIVVDYVQLMPPPPGVREREQSVSENVRGLKQLAKELDCTVLVLSQLSREVSKRNDKRPTMADFKESGAIEETADVALSLYRHSYYHKGDKDNDTEVGLLKQRHGPTGVVRVGFEPRATRFYNLSEAASGGNWQDGSDR